MKVTRTINPLHFEDLEPHRFEDLVRQLVYDFRSWSSIEAVGRSGADEGIDIRATERVHLETEREDEDLEEDGEPRRDSLTKEQTWIIQCKREQTMGPAKVAKIVENDLSRQSESPYGYMIVAACNFSKAARDTFRRAVTSFGVREFHLWGKGELEDLLFLPKYDHLLFAYFGISLQVKRRSMKTQLSSNLTLKRKLVKVLGDVKGTHFQQVLIRDPRDPDYPFIKSAKDFKKNPRWRYWTFNSHEPPDHLAFIARRCFGYVDWEKGQWDALLDFDDSPGYLSLSGLSDERNEDSEKRTRYWRFWFDIPEANRAWFNEMRVIPYERIMAVDELGDSFNDAPHLLVEYRTPEDPFERWSYRYLESARSYDSRTVTAERETRTKYFPDSIPEPPPPGPTEQS